MTRLAVFGGAPSVPRGERHVQWPVVTDADRAAVLRVLDSGAMVTNASGENIVPEFERRWARQVEVGHCIAVSNGTVALQLAMFALGIGPGDEVIVPALSFVASAFGPMHQMAVPIFADIDPITFNIDPADVERRITPRTAAIIAVHMHGLPADMDALCAIADRHGLAIVEDAAQAHGAVIRGRPVGGWGRLGAFSIQVTKNLPTCGEGGMVTTDDADLAGLVLRGRQFGEIVDSETPRDYVCQHLGWNGKLNPVQAAFTLSQMDRFDEYDKARQANIAPFLQRLAALPGIQVPATPEDRTHAYHLLRFRFSLDEADPVMLRKALSRLLRAEGVPVGQYQRMPLPAQKVMRETYPEADADYPITTQVIADSLVIAKHHLHPDSGPLLQRYADAFEKVWEQLDVVRSMTRGQAQ